MNLFILFGRIHIFARIFLIRNFHCGISKAMDIRIKSHPDLYRRMVTFYPVSVNMNSSDLPVFVYQCIESHTIPPASGEIVNVDIGVPAKDKAQEKSYRITK